MAYKLQNAKVADRWDWWEHQHGKKTEWVDGLAAPSTGQYGTGAQSSGYVDWSQAAPQQTVPPTSTTNAGAPPGLDAPNSGQTTIPQDALAVTDPWARGTSQDRNPINVAVDSSRLANWDCTPEDERDKVPGPRRPFGDRTDVNFDDEDNGIIAAPIRSADCKANKHGDPYNDMSPDNIKFIWGKIKEHSLQESINLTAMVNAKAAGVCLSYERIPGTFITVKLQPSEKKCVHTWAKMNHLESRSLNRDKSSTIPSSWAYVMWVGHRNDPAPASAPSLCNTEHPIITHSQACP